MDENMLEVPNETEEPTVQESKEASTKNKSDNVGKRPRSLVWDHFTKLDCESGKKPRASCNYCGVTYACDPKINGTKSKRGLTRLYEWYVLNVQNESMQPQSMGQPSREMNLDKDHDTDVRTKMKSKFKMHLEEENHMVNKSELERYLVEGCEEDDDNFDVLGWWKTNSTKYRILSHMARDVLAIPVSTVASESAFSTGGRVLDPFRSSLSPSTVEALICAQNWFRSPSQINLTDQLEELEELDSVLMEGTSNKDVTVID